MGMAIGREARDHWQPRPHWAEALPAPESADDDEDEDAPTWLGREWDHTDEDDA